MDGAYLVLCARAVVPRHAGLWVRHWLAPARIDHGRPHHHARGKILSSCSGGCRWRVRVDKTIGEADIASTKKRPPLEAACFMKPNRFERPHCALSDPNSNSLNCAEQFTPLTSIFNRMLRYRG